MGGRTPQLMIPRLLAGADWIGVLRERHAVTGTVIDSPGSCGGSFELSQFLSTL